MEYRAAAMDHQGGQGGLAAADVSPSDESLEEKRKLMLETQRRMEETQRNLAAQMAAVQEEEARIEQEERMKKERIEAEATRIEAEAARMEQEKKMEKERIEQEKKMAKERIDEAEERPPPRMVVRDVIHYITVEGPLEDALHDFREKAREQEEYIRANPLPLTVNSVRKPNPQLALWAKRREEVAIFLEDTRSLSDSVGFLTQQGYQPLGSAFQTGRALQLSLPNLRNLPSSKFYRNRIGLNQLPPNLPPGPSEFNLGLFAQVMVKYGPPRYDTPYLWNKTEESIAEHINSVKEAAAAESGTDESSGEEERRQDLRASHADEL